MPFKLGAVLLHSAAVAIMARAWFQLDKLPNNAWVERQVGGHLQFLTIQGYAPQNVLAELLLFR